MEKAHCIKQGRTGSPGCLALARWAGWSAGQVGRHVKCWSRDSRRAVVTLSKLKCFQQLYGNFGSLRSVTRLFQTRSLNSHLLLFVLGHSSTHSYPKASKSTDKWVSTVWCPTPHITGHFRDPRPGVAQLWLQLGLKPNVWMWVVGFTWVGWEQTFIIPKL